MQGIGEYTANALLALVYNQPKIPFDGNVKRVFLRLFNLTLEKDENKRADEYNTYVEKLLDTHGLTR